MSTPCVHTANANNDAYKKNQLEEFYSRRRTATTTTGALTIQQSFLLGSSVVAGAILKEYTSGTIARYPYFPRGNRTFAFNGLYALALPLFVCYVVGAEVIIPFTKKYPKAQPLIALSLSLLVPVAFILGGVSSSIDNNVVLMYISFALILGVSLATHDAMTRIESIQWWAVDGNKNVGVGIVGLTAGISSVFYTVTTAWIIVYSNSLATCLYCIGGFQALI
jgi:hypothetical protein